jgi:hypothetical protein
MWLTLHIAYAVNAIHSSVVKVLAPARGSRMEPTRSATASRWHPLIISPHKGGVKRFLPLPPARTLPLSVPSFGSSAVGIALGGNPIRLQHPGRAVKHVRHDVAHLVLGVLRRTSMFAQLVEMILLDPATCARSPFAAAKLNMQ